MTKRDVDVIVVGYGPVGATVSALLGNAGLSVLAIDRDPEPYILPRAVATDDDALRVWQTVPGLAASLTANMINSPRVKDTSFERADLMSADPSLATTPSGHPALTLFHQPSLETVIRAAAEATGTVEARRGVELTDFEQDGDGVTATLRDPDGAESHVRAGWLLGCDGASSTVRGLLGANFDGSTFAQPWVVADVILEEPDEASPLIEFICDPQRPAVTMPMPGGRRRWEFILKPDETEDELLDPARLSGLIDWAGNPGPYEIERAVVYTFHARISDSWGNGRVFLLGDAAHLTPPFAGQGMTSGIRDAGKHCSTR